MTKRLDDFRKHEGIPINAQLDEFSLTIMYLKNVEIKIENEDKTLIMLCSLPTSYINFADIFVNGKDNMLVNIVSNALKTK